jgi:LruC domain-containing protein
MTRSLFSMAAAALVALASASVLASPTASLTLSVNQFGNTAHAVKSNASVSVIANYQVTNIGPGQSVHIELDFCAPGANPSGQGGFTARHLTGCTDGYGYDNAVTILSPTLSAGSGSTGITGNFVVDVSTVPGLTYNGEAWSVPGRIILDNSGGAPLANDTLAMTIVAAPQLYLYKQASGTHDNGDGTTNVTWFIQLENPDTFAGTEPATGTTTISDPASSGGTFVSGQRVGKTTITNPIPLWQTINPNSNASVSSAGGEAIITIDNLVSGDGSLPSADFALVFSYPTGTTAHLVSNTASLVGPSGQMYSATAQTYIGPNSSGVAGTISKVHFCPDSPGGGETRTANLPNLYDNADCFWSPEYPLSYELTLTSAFSDTGQPTRMTNGDVIDALAPQTELAVLQTIDPAWHAFTSTDGSCTSGSSWTAASPGQRNFSGVHCVRFTQVGAGYAYGYAFFTYTVKLSSSQASTLEGEPGAYIFATNTATLTGDFVSVNGIGGSTSSASVTSTFWNTVAPMDSLTSPYDGQFGTGSAAIGNAFDLTASLPFTSQGPILDTAGFHGLSFSGTLPTQLDLTGAPTGSPYLDDQGQPTHLDCTWSAQDRSTTPVTPAKYRCQVVNAAGMPTFTPSISYGAPNPFTAASSASGCSPPYFCQSGLYAGYNDGYYNGGTTPPIWNELVVTIPVVAVSGVAGQYFTVSFNTWSNEGNTYPSGLAYRGTSEAKPAIAQTVIGIAGLPQLKVQTTATSNNVVVGQDAVFNINYSNSGQVSTAGTYVYDIFGYDATTGASLTGYQNLNCTGAAPKFDGVTHVSGAPSSVVQYTTDDPSAGIASLTWSTTAPSNLTTVTGVRFLLNSEFSQTAGDYGPSDQHGQEQLRFIAPNDPGSRLCSMAAIKATGLNLAGSIDLTSAEQIITNTCVDNCNPVAHTPPTATATADASCSATVTLDATGSTEATHFAWYEGNTLIASSDAPVFTVTATLSGPGQHGITLVASDALGIAAQASTVVTLVDHTAPVITCQASPGNVSLAANCSTSTPAITATAVDACEGNKQTVCDIYQPGQTSVTCTTTDSAGNRSSCSVAVEVTGGPAAPSLTGGDLAGDAELQPVQSDNNFCDAILNDYFYFTWNPGCTTVNPQVTGTVTYVDSTGAIKNLYVNQTYIQVDANGAQSGFISFQPPNDPVTGNAIDYVGPLTFTVHGSNGGSSSLVVQTGFEKCTCNYLQDNGQAMILFEDLWPSNGDFDFNDAAIVHDFSYQTDTNNNVTTMRAQFNLVALGADIANGLYLHLPGLTAADVASMQVYTSDSQTPRNISVVPGESELVLQIAANTRDLFNGKSGFINTAFGPIDASASAQIATDTAKAVTVIINFTNPLPAYDPGDGSRFLDTSAAPYDLFLARVGQYSHQIHQPRYAGTTTMDASLFNHMDDNSGGGLHFINGNNIPFALTMPGLYWPQERIDIGLLYPELIPYSEGIFGANNENYGWYYDRSVVPGNGVHLADPSLLPSAGPQLVDNRNGCQNQD